MSAVMSRALKILEEVDQAGGEIDQVAERLGMTDRHLRRLFQEHLGASPLEIAISRRLHLARQLLSESSLPVIDIALASGFGSIRRFHDAFSKSLVRRVMFLRLPRLSSLKPMSSLAAARGRVDLNGRQSKQ